MLLLYLERAYETVWIYGLLYKLIRYQLLAYLLFIIKAFLVGCSFTVHLKGALSSPKSTPSGLPQGAVLSTTLFALYRSDMPHPPDTLLALYADDTAILAQSWRTDTIVNRLTRAMTILLRYFTKWKLQVNVHVILFSRRSPVAPALFRFRAAIPWNSQVRYLGLVLDPKLLFTKHLVSIVHKASGVLLQLFPLLARDSILSLAKKLFLYTFIRSMLTYAAPVWSNTSRSNLCHLQVSQYKCLRVVGNYPSCTPIPYLHAALSIPPIQNSIYRLTFHFFTRCSAHSNPFVRSIGDYTLPDLNCQYKKYLHKRP
jgi:hypothetical protein